MFDLYQRVSLNSDFPEHHLKKGDYFYGFLFMVIDRT